MQYPLPRLSNSESYTAGVRIHNTEKDKLWIIAEKQGITYGKLVRVALLEYIDRNLNSQ